MSEQQAYDLYKTRTKEIFKNQKSILEITKTWKYENYKDILSLEDFKKAIRLKERRQGKRRRCYKKLIPILNYFEEFKDLGIKCNLVFGTCTFDSNSMKWKEETRTKKINKWIKEHFVIALANIDYGEKSEREHHHFIGLTFEDLKDTGKKGKKGYKLFNLATQNNYNLGFAPDLERILLIEDERKLSNYLVKIQNHSNKTSAINRRIRLLKNLPNW